MSPAVDEGCCSVVVAHSSPSFLPLNPPLCPGKFLRRHCCLLFVLRGTLSWTSCSERGRRGREGDSGAGPSPMRPKAGLLPTLGPEVSSDISIVDSGTVCYQSEGSAAGTTGGSFKEASQTSSQISPPTILASCPPPPHFHFVPSSSSPFLLILLLWRHVFAPFILAKVAALPPSLPHPAAAAAEVRG